MTTFYIKVCHAFISLVTFNKFLLSQVIAAVALSFTSLCFVSSKCSQSCYQETKSDVLGLGAFPVLANLTLWLYSFKKKKNLLTELFAMTAETFSSSYSILSVLLMIVCDLCLAVGASVDFTVYKLTFFFFPPFCRTKSSSL